MTYKIPRWSDLQESKLLTKITIIRGRVTTHDNSVISLRQLQRLQNALRKNGVLIEIPSRAIAVGYLTASEYMTFYHPTLQYGREHSTFSVGFLIIESLDPTIKEAIQDIHEDDD